MAKRNVEAIKTWIETLRSGEYRKTKLALRLKGKKSYSFCALGVATDLFRKQFGGEWVGDMGDNFKYEGCTYGCEELPPPVASWLFGDKRRTNPKVPIFDNEGKRREVDLTSVNDGSIFNRAFSFNEIANILEDHYVWG